ncbi:MFS transporter, partial [Bacillus thuringiensis]|nr:MFS transporter [Bacillus thuringiensis]
MKSVLKNRSFFFMWIGSAISELGGAFGTLCNSILVYELTGSEMALSSMWLLYFIPSLILQLISGPFIDKWSRKWIMIFSQWMRASVFLLPLVMLLTNSIEVWHVYVVQIIIGLITPLYTPASQAITPSIVGKEQLQDANAYIDGMTRFMMFLGPVLAGVVIHLIGTELTLSFVCICLFVSGALLLNIKEKRTKQPIRKTWLEQFLRGFTYFFTKPVIVWLGIFLTFVQFGVGVHAHQLK